MAAHILDGEVMLSASPIIYLDVSNCIDSIITNEML